MRSQKRILIFSLFMAYLMACLGAAAFAMNSEMTFNLDGYTLDTSAAPQQSQQTVQQPAAGVFQQDLPNSAITFDQGFTASSLFGETDSYKLTWNEDVNFSVLVDNIQAKNGDPVKGGEEIVVTANITAGYSFTDCTVACQYKFGENTYDYGNIEEKTATQCKIVLPATLCSDVTLTVTIQRSYPITINGAAITDTNKSGSIAGGSVSYFPDRNVLMLSGATVDSIEIRTPTTILFTGSNSVGTIYSSAALTISSSAQTDQLTVTAPAADYSRGIYVEGASLTVSSGANVWAQAAGGTKLSAGVEVSGYLEVSGSLNATGGSAAESYGIRCSTLAVKTVNSAAGGEVIATGGDCYTGGSSTGVSVSGNAVVEYAASLTAAGKGASSVSRGISAGGLTVQGNAGFEAGAGWIESTALYSTGNVTSSGNLTAVGGSASGGTSRGISAAALTVTGGATEANAASGANGSVGILGTVTISGGTVLAEGMNTAFSTVPVFAGGYQPRIRVSELNTGETEADSTVAANYLKKHVFVYAKNLTLTPSQLTMKVGESQKLNAIVPSGYSVSWYSSTPNVTVDQITGTVTGVSAGTAIVTAKAYNPSNAESDSATCTVTVTANSGAAVTGIHFDQENVTLNTKYGLRTVKYWFSPLGAGSPELTWKCTDATGSIVRFEVSEAEQELYITSVGNGVAVISASTKNGISAYCRVTVSGIGGETSVYIDYIDNSGVWYYDRSDSFSVRCTGKVSDLLGIYLDGVYVPQVGTDGQRNYTVSDSGGKTLIVFTRTYMARLYRGAHTLALSYSGYGTISKTIYVQSVKDVPRTGDVSLTGTALSGLLALTGAGCCFRKLRKKEQ
mgnify:CR=1 FL=1